MIRKFKKGGNTNPEMQNVLTTIYGDSYINMDQNKRKQLERQYLQDATARNIMQQQARQMQNQQIQNQAEILASQQPQMNITPVVQKKEVVPVFEDYTDEITRLNTPYTVVTDSWGGIPRTDPGYIEGSGVYLGVDENGNRVRFHDRGPSNAVEYRTAAVDELGTKGLREKKQTRTIDVAKRQLGEKTPDERAQDLGFADADTYDLWRTNVQVTNAYNNELQKQKEKEELIQLNAILGRDGRYTDLESARQAVANRERAERNADAAFHGGVTAPVAIGGLTLGAATAPIWTTVGLGVDYLQRNLMQNYTDYDSVGDWAYNKAVQNGWTIQNPTGQFYGTMVGDMITDAVGTGLVSAVADPNIPLNIRSSYRNLTRGGIDGSKNIRMQDLRMKALEPTETFGEPEMVLRTRMDSRTPGATVNRGGFDGPNSFKNGYLHEVSPYTRNAYVPRRFRMLRPLGTQIPTGLEAGAVIGSGIDGIETLYDPEEQTIIYKKGGQLYNKNGIRKALFGIRFGKSDADKMADNAYQNELKRVFGDKELTKEEKKWAEKQWKSAMSDATKNGKGLNDVRIYDSIDTSFVDDALKRVQDYNQQMVDDFYNDPKRKGKYLKRNDGTYAPLPFEIPQNLTQNPPTTPIPEKYASALSAQPSVDFSAYAKQIGLLDPKSYQEWVNMTGKKNGATSDLLKVDGIVGKNTYSYLQKPGYTIDAYNAWQNQMNAIQNAANNLIQNSTNQQKPSKTNPLLNSSITGNEMIDAPLNMITSMTPFGLIRTIGSGFNLGKTFVHNLLNPDDKQDYNNEYVKTFLTSNPVVAPIRNITGLVNGLF